MNDYFGKYRGKVIENVDPEGLGRLLIMAPGVLNEDEMWAMPCVPYAGPDQGFIILPGKGANVWVEFEGGDLRYPIWTGCFWSEKELPAAARPGNMVLKTPIGAIIMDAKVGLRIELAGSDMVIEMRRSGGLFIANGRGATIELNQKTIKFNDDGLEIA